MNKKSVFIEKKYVEWGGFLNEFLWICAGVNRTVLRQCPTDYAKYAGIGGTILFTALMACLSGSYALYSVFYNAYVAIGFGIFWGLLIFNLDRFIVNTMYSDGKSTISWKELMSGAPRIVMAIFLGIVISTPLELKIFEDAIDIRIEQDKEKIMNERISGSVHERDSIAQKRDELMNGSTEVSMFNSEITTGNKETNNLLAEANAIQEKITSAKANVARYQTNYNNLKYKLNNTDKTSNQYNTLKNQLRNAHLKLAEAKKAERAIKSELNKKQGEIAASDKTLKQLLTNKSKETHEEVKRLQLAVQKLDTIIHEANTKHYDWSEDKIIAKGSFRDKLDLEYKGFQAKMHAFSELKNENTSTRLSALFIMLLFVIIETAPTFFKMMMEDGPYDFLLNAEKEMIRLNASDSIRDYKEELQANIQISSERNKERIDAERIANSQLLGKITSLQLELLDEALQKWKSEELAKIEEDPSKIIITTE